MKINFKFESLSPLPINLIKTFYKKKIFITAYRSQELGIIESRDSKKIQDKNILDNWKKSSKWKLINEIKIHYTSGRIFPPRLFNCRQPSTLCSSRSFCFVFFSLFFPFFTSSLYTRGQSFRHLERLTPINELRGYKS